MAQAERKELAGEREALKAQYAATTEVAKALNMARIAAVEAATAEASAAAEGEGIKAHDRHGHGLLHERGRLKSLKK